jgi:hypothetical protein
MKCPSIVFISSIVAAITTRLRAVFQEKNRENRNKNEPPGVLKRFEEAEDESLGGGNQLSFIRVEIGCDLFHGLGAPTVLSTQLPGQVAGVYVFHQNWRLSYERVHLVDDRRPGDDENHRE